MRLIILETNVSR